MKGEKWENTQVGTVRVELTSVHIANFLPLNYVPVLLVCSEPSTECPFYCTCIGVRSKPLS